MRLAAAVLVLLGGAAACASGQTRINTPVLDLEFGSAPDPGGTQVFVPAGESASISVGQPPAMPEVQAEPEPEPEPAPAQPPIAPESSPAEGEGDAWRQFALDALSLQQVGLLEMARILVGGGGESDATPRADDANDDDPSPSTTFVGPPIPEGHDPELAAVLREDEGESLAPYEDTRGFWHIGVGHRLTPAEQEAMFREDMAEAEGTARRVLGEDAWSGLDRWRRNAWIVACFWGGCGSYERMKAATLSGDWETAAREAMTTGLPTSWAAINPERAAELARWLRTGER